MAKKIHTNFVFGEYIGAPKDEALRAAKVVAHNSIDRDDAAFLLEILGLTPPSEPVKSVKQVKYATDRKQAAERRKAEYERLGVTPEEVGDEPLTESDEDI